VGVSVVATGILPYTAYKDIAHPISYAVEQFSGYRWLAITINVGALCGITSVILVSLLAQPRIFYTISSDGLLPPSISDIHPRFKTPARATLISGIMCSLMAGFLPLGLLSELASVGTLMAFFVVCIGVMILRKTHPHRHRDFRVPGGPIIPTLGALSCIGLISMAKRPTLYRLVAWMAFGLMIYFSYGFHHSKLRSGGGGGEEEGDPSHTSSMKEEGEEESKQQQVQMVGFLDEKDGTGYSSE